MKQIIQDFLDLVEKTPQKLTLSKVQACLLDISKLKLEEAEADMLMEGILTYIDIVINISAKRGYKEQIKICKQWFDVLQEFINDKIRNLFVLRVTHKVFDILIEEDVNSWCVKKHLLLMFVACLEDVPKAVRCKIVQDLPDIYLFKIVDSISTYGDYDFQAALIELVFRMYGRNVVVSKLPDLIPESQELSQSFANISAETFDEDVRKFLNALNENTKKVFSIVCNAVILDDVNCGKLTSKLDGLWVDFNLSENAVSWYCSSECLVEEEDRDGSESGWSLVTFFVTDVDVIRILRRPQSEDAVVYVKLKNGCISSCDSSIARRAGDVKLVVRHGTTPTKNLIAHVLPAMFKHKFQHNMPKLSLGRKSVYKPLRVSTRRKSKSESSRSKSDVSGFTARLDPKRRPSVSSGCEVITVSDDGSEGGPKRRDADSQYETAQMCPLNQLRETSPAFSQPGDRITILSGRCSGSKAQEESEQKCSVSEYLKAAKSGVQGGNKTVSSSDPPRSHRSSILESPPNPNDILNTSVNGNRNDFSQKCSSSGEFRTAPTRNVETVPNFKDSEQFESIPLEDVLEHFKNTSRSEEQPPVEENPSYEREVSLPDVEESPVENEVEKSIVRVEKSKENCNEVVPEVNEGLEDGNVAVSEEEIDTEDLLPDVLATEVDFESKRVKEQRKGEVLSLQPKGVVLEAPKVNVEAINESETPKKVGFESKSCPKRVKNRIVSKIKKYGSDEENSNVPRDESSKNEATIEKNDKKMLTETEKTFVRANTSKEVLEAVVSSSESILKVSKRDNCVVLLENCSDRHRKDLKSTGASEEFRIRSKTNKKPNVLIDDEENEPENVDVVQPTSEEENSTKKIPIEDFPQKKTKRIVLNRTILKIKKEKNLQDEEENQDLPLEGSDREDLPAVETNSVQTDREEKSRSKKRDSDSKTKKIRNGFEEIHKLPRKDSNQENPVAVEAQKNTFSVQEEKIKSKKRDSGSKTKKIRNGFEEIHKLPREDSNQENPVAVEAQKNTFSVQEEKIKSKKRDLGSKTKKIRNGFEETSELPREDSNQENPVAVEAQKNTFSVQEEKIKSKKRDSVSKRKKIRLSFENSAKFPQVDANQENLAVNEAFKNIQSDREEKIVAEKINLDPKIRKNRHGFEESLKLPLKDSNQENLPAIETQKNTSKKRDSKSKTKKIRLSFENAPKLPQVDANQEELPVNETFKTIQTDREEKIVAKTKDFDSKTEKNRRDFGESLDLLLKDSNREDLPVTEAFKTTREEKIEPKKGDRASKIEKIHPSFEESPFEHKELIKPCVVLVPKDVRLEEINDTSSVESYENNAEKPTETESLNKPELTRQNSNDSDIGRKKIKPTRMLSASTAENDTEKPVRNCEKSFDELRREKPLKIDPNILAGYSQETVKYNVEDAEPNQPEKAEINEINEPKTKTVLDQTFSTARGGRRQRKLYDASDLSHLENLTYVDEEPQQPDTSKRDPDKTKCKKPEIKPTKTSKKVKESSRSVGLGSFRDWNTSKLGSTFHGMLESFRKEANTSFAASLVVESEQTKNKDPRKTLAKKNAPKQLKRMNVGIKPAVMRDTVEESDVSPASLKLRKRRNSSDSPLTEIEKEGSPPPDPNKKIKILSHIKITPKGTLLEDVSGVPTKKKRLSKNAIVAQNITNREICEWIESGSPNYRPQSNSERRIVLKHAYSMFRSALGQSDDSEEYRDMLQICRKLKKYL